MHFSTRSVALSIGALVLLIVLIANALAALGSVTLLHESFENIERPGEVRRTLLTMLSTIQDAETAQRGYLLTGKAEYLAPYEGAPERIDSLFTELDSLVSWNDLQVGRLPALRLTVDEKMSELSETIRMAEADSLTAALALVNTERGAALMADLRLQFAAMKAEATRMRASRRAETDEAKRTATLALLVTNGVLLLTILGIGLLLRRNLRIREEASAKARASNEALAAALTDRQNALAHVQAMQSQLIQQEKLTSLGRLTAGVAHELKNPLNFVNNFAQLSQELVVDMKQALRDGDTGEAALLMTDLEANSGKILQHGHRANQIIQSMLIHAGGVQGERRRTDLHDLLRTAQYQAMGPAPDGAIRIEHEFDPGLDGDSVPVVGSAVTRMFLNLIQNAVHAVRDRAAMGDPAYRPRIVLRTEQGRDRTGRAVARVIVSDNGVGIREEIRERIFEPFYTTKNPGKGTGLGLSLAYDIATSHDGSIMASPSENGGASFIVQLPLETPSDAASNSTDTQES